LLLQIRLEGISNLTLDEGLRHRLYFFILCWIFTYSAANNIGSTVNGLIAISRVPRGVSGDGDEII
jgi:hypothetical protein